MARCFVLDSETVTAAPLEFLSTLMKIGLPHVNRIKSLSTATVITKVTMMSDDEDEMEPHNAYFWGDITAAEAVEKLKTEKPGTFLLRKNGNQFKLSWKDFDSKLKHSHVKEAGGGYSLTSQRVFPTLHALTSFYQTQTGKNALGDPLMNLKAIEEMEQG